MTGAGTSTLVYGSSAFDPARRWLEAPSSADADLAVVAYGEPISAWLSEARDVVGHDAVTRLVAVGERTRSTAAGAPTGPSGLDGPTGLTVECLDDRTDPTALGLAVDDHLRTAAGTPAVYVDAVAPLVESIGLERTFRLLHVLRGRAAAVGGELRCRLDVERCDAAAVETLASLFDDVSA